MDRCIPVWNRAPLAPTAYALLPLGQLRAQGWLLEQLRLSAGGLSGHLPEVWPDVGTNNGWRGGSGESWERGPYYLRGLLGLAHVLGDAELIARTQPWIEWTLGSQRPDGFFGPPDNDDWWPRMPMMEALRLHHDATGDPRVLPFLRRYLHHQVQHLPSRPLDAWARPRGGDNTATALWVYNRTGDPDMLALADLLHRQTSDWVAELGGGGVPDKSFEFGHGVNRAMGLKEPIVYFQRSRLTAHRDALRTGWARTLEYHGQIQGTFSGDEFLHGRGSTQGTELCTIVELLSSLSTALIIGGELWVADAIERIAYNALPAILSADHRAHQYFQLPNQVECTPGGRNFHVHHETDLLFGVAPGYGCCAANYHMGWPVLVRHLWMATADGGLAAMILAPCQLDACLGEVAVRITTETVYPFEGRVQITVEPASPIQFPLRMRIPGWAEQFAVTVNGEPIAEDGLEVPPHAGAARLATLSRTWRGGDRVVLELPASIRLSDWERGSLGVERGPLVYALRVGEDWRPVSGEAPFFDYEVHPTTAWNYGLRVDRADPRAGIREVHVPMGVQPWAQDGAPVRLQVEGKRLPQWVASGGVSEPIPESGLSPATSPEELTLVPFGCARLRISMFPVVA
jgi:hypothetical protein